MRLSTEMKNLSGDILNSFKQRIKENEELVNDVQKTLDGFRKDHQEMADILNANAAALRNNLAQGEKERLNTFRELMSGIHNTIGSIQTEVVAIQTSTFNMINGFITDRAQMAAELSKFFSQGKADRMQNEKLRMKEFDDLMKNINADIKNINDEVLGIFKSTNELLGKFEKEHLEMSVELRAELGKNLAERVEYTRSLLNGFQQRLSDISKGNQKMAQQLRNDLANGEKDRLSEYNRIMKDIHQAIKGIRKEVNDIRKDTSGMIADYALDRSQASAEWKKMQDAVAQMRETAVISPKKEKVVKTEKKKEVKPMIEEVTQVTSSPILTEVETEKEIPTTFQPEEKPKNITPMTLEEKVLDYINGHPKGVKISEMEEPLGETRMKLGFIAKVLLDEGKVQKVENIYFPLK
jgi:hypothetical protein